MHAESRLLPERHFCKSHEPARHCRIKNLASWEKRRLSQCLQKATLEYRSSLGCASQQILTLPKLLSIASGLITLDGVLSILPTIFLHSIPPPIPNYWKNFVLASLRIATIFDGCIGRLFPVELISNQAHPNLVQKQTARTTHHSPSAECKQRYY